MHGSLQRMSNIFVAQKMSGIFVPFRQNVHFLAARKCLLLLQYGRADDHKHLLNLQLVKNNTEVGVFMNTPHAILRKRLFAEVTFISANASQIVVLHTEMPSKHIIREYFDVGISKHGYYPTLKWSVQQILWKWLTTMSCCRKQLYKYPCNKWKIY